MSDTPRTDAILSLIPGGQTCDPQLVADELRPKIAELERELAAATRSPYIDSDESPVEIISAICDALDGITDDAANGRNFGTLVSRVKVAVSMAIECEQERALADRLAGLLGDCREDSCELLGERGWWKDESRCGYSKRYDETSENIARADEAIAAWKASRDPNNLEGTGPTEEERRENARAIQAMSEPERFDLMFRNKEGGGE